MQTVTTIGLDIAKSVFQVHGVDAAGNVIVRRQLKRRYVLAFFQKLPPCLVGIEACASSHHWSRELAFARHRRRNQISITITAIPRRCEQKTSGWNRKSKNRPKALPLSGRKNQLP